MATNIYVVINFFEKKGYTVNQVNYMGQTAYEMNGKIYSLHQIKEEYKRQGGKA